MSEIPQWKEENIGNKLKLLSGFPFFSSRFSTEEGMPLIRIRDVLDSKIETYYTGSYLPMYVIRQGDILIGMDGDFHISKWNNQDALLNQRVLKIEVLDSNEMDLEFVFYWLQPFIKKVNDITAATTVKHLSVKDVKKAKGKIPKKPVQTKIGVILSNIDRAIESTQALIEKYQLIKAGLMHDLFTRGIGADGKLRPPREAAPELYQETAIGWIPKEWELPKIGEIFSLQLGKMLSQVAKTGKAELPYLGNKNVQWNEFDFTTLETMSFSEPEKEKFKLIYGDLLVCEGGDVGRSAIWKDELSECYYQKAIHRLRPINKKVLPSFALRFMHYAKSTGILLNFTSQTSIAHLTREKLAEVPIFLPSLLEQEILTKKFDLVDVRISTEIKLLEKLRKQKAGLMHDLLTGKVQVKVDDDESDN